MPNATDTALTAEEIQQGLAELPGWHVEENKIKKVFSNTSYVAALAFVQRVGELAEQQDHHPDVLLTWPSTTLWYWTHTANGITSKDLYAAQTVEALVD